MKDDMLARHREVARERRKRGSKRKKEEAREKKEENGIVDTKIKRSPNNQEICTLFSNFTFRNFYSCCCPSNFKMMH